MAIGEKTSRNDITGALIKSKSPSDDYLKNYGNIKFGVLAAEKEKRESLEEETDAGE